MPGAQIACPGAKLSAHVVRVGGEQIYQIFPLLEDLEEDVLSDGPLMMVYKNPAEKSTVVFFTSRIWKSFRDTPFLMHKFHKQMAS